MAGDGKDIFDKLSSLTPLLIGLCVTGVGAIFTNVYNNRQLQLNQIQALDKLRPLLVSDKPEDRAFAYASFSALGYEQVAIGIIQAKQDSSGGRGVLVQLTKTGTEENRALASQALTGLDQAQDPRRKSRRDAHHRWQAALPGVPGNAPNSAQRRDRRLQAARDLCP